MSRTSLRRLVCAAALAAGVFVGSSGDAPLVAQPAWRTQADRVPARYTIDATLRSIDGEDSPRQIQGRETIVFTNYGHEPVESLWFHLYANAWRDEESAFVREMKREGRPVPDPMTWGGTDIQQLTVVNSTNGRQPVMEFVPCEGAPGDRTVMRAKLPQPVEKGASVVLRVDFTTKLPRPIARMGATRDFVMAAQWYPKLGQRIDAGTGTGVELPWARNVHDGWYCHHYHAGPEFAADFADYDVTLHTPDTWTVGATGIPIPPSKDAPRDEIPGTRTVTWQAKSVVDFAWTAGLRYVERVRTIRPDDLSAGDAVANQVSGDRSLLGAGDEDTALPPVEVHLLLQPEHLDQEERHFEAARVALSLFGTWLGPYPYARLTIVDPAHDAPVGGMEYPMLVTAGTSAGTPLDARRPEHVVVHEIGHQWFMNLLASNEAEEAWLDEGLNSWFTARAMHRAWGPNTQLTTILGNHFSTEPPISFPGLTAGWPDALDLPGWVRPPDLEIFRLWRDAPLLLSTTAWRYRPDQDPTLPARRSYLRSAGTDELVKTGWEYMTSDSYRGNAYPRGILLMETIARHVRDRFDRPDDRDGERRVLRAFREYARQFRFGHPTTADLLRVLRRETDLVELPQLFEALAKTTGLLDFSVEPVRVVEEHATADAPARTWSEILVRRRGEVVVPVTIRCGVHGAKEPVLLRWDAAERWKRFAVEGRVTTVMVDPQQFFPQDARLSDNVWTDRRSARPGVKWGTHALVWLEHALASWGRFF
ncbi:MAG: M1 family metallopeptidase [Planctomycetes bacterium]|nr:M1 family metallopeptidase [Planctomycetota bacterium]